MQAGRCLDPDKVKAKAKAKVNWSTAATKAPVITVLEIGATPATSGCLVDNPDGL